ncbi:uncharacterized protein LOC134692495 [Mytilus trossulus]|uniref:uncharacterized protein LOC134692495 n=1 Tax=Mytilus trossulus TaxID=6551 RepID=UPI003003D36C
MSCTTECATFKKRILIACLILILADNVISKDCRTGQKLRVNIQGDQICCTTVKCEKSQQFRYCHYDGESDICKNCTNNSFTNDQIDTSQWPYHDEKHYQSEPDVCVSPPSCEADGVVLVGRTCQCNLNGGYWGKDQHNCQLDKQNCRRAGVQLTYEGKCVRCSGDTFKKEDDKYRQCINKTLCKSHERESSSGSPTSDRICEKLPTERPPITTAPPDIGTTNKIEKEDDDSIPGWIVAVIVLTLVIVVVVIAVLIILYKKNESFAGCCRRLIEYFQRGFQSIRGHRPAGPQFEAVALNETGAVEHSENEPQETRIEMDETRLSNGINGNCSPAANGGAGSNKNNHDKPRISNTDRNDTIPKHVSNEDYQLSSLEDETDPKSVINDVESESNIPTTVEEAESHPPGKTKESDGFQSLSSSIYNGSSGHEADHSALSSHDRQSESIPEMQPSLPNYTTPMSENDASTSTGNRPSSSLIEDLETMDGSEKTPVLTTPAKKEKVIGLVAPIPRSPENNPANPNFGQADNRQHQDFPRSNTTAGGIEVETPTNDQDYKFAPSHTNRAELEPLIVDVPGKQATENQHSVEPSVTNRDNEIAENGAQPPQRSSSENGVQSTHRSSSENLTQPLRTSGTTESGQLLVSPESDNSQGSSTAQNSMEDDPQENMEVTARAIANSRTTPVD